MHTDMQDSSKMRSRQAPNQFPVPFMEHLLIICRHALKRRQRKGFYQEFISHLKNEQRKVSHIATFHDFTASLWIFDILLKALLSCRISLDEDFCIRTYLRMHFYSSVDSIFLS